MIIKLNYVLTTTLTKYITQCITIDNNMTGQFKYMILNIVYIYICDLICKKDHFFRNICDLICEKKTFLKDTKEQFSIHIK